MPAMWRVGVLPWGYRIVLLIMRAWWVVARPRSSGVRCLLRRGDSILLVRHSYGDRRWMLPGGRMRHGEAPVATARREMRHELGIDAGRWTVLGCLGARPGYRRRSRTEGFRRHSTHYVAAELSSIAVSPRAAEIAEARWFPCGTLPDDRSEALDAVAARGWLEASTGAEAAHWPREDRGHDPHLPRAHARRP
jgi:8-oxo-dGTP pyrophosphatase MutT (NUDIX family)